jgi:ubiquinone/menaquinone biosynthesis C-methylase UbiE
MAPPRVEDETVMVSGDSHSAKINDAKNVVARTSPKGEEKKTMEDDSEREVWEFMTPKAWHDSVASEGSIFLDTYKITRKQIEDTVKQGGFDVIIEVGCGTGDIIGELNTDVDCYGLDINREFIRFCQENHPHDHCEFLVADALHLKDWYDETLGSKGYKKPLITCVNNTLNIMPNELRGTVVDQMLAVSGKEGLSMVSYWNGNFFSHAILNYYKKNEALCGAFDMSHVNWEKRHLLTPTNYSTEWHYPHEVQQLLRAYDIDVPNIEDSPKLGTSHINCDGLAIFVWFAQDASSHAKLYYDSEDAQKFYKGIWGEETIHLGQYQLLTEEEKKTLSVQEQVQRAQNLHEQEFIKVISSKCIGDHQPKARVVDMGCGFGGLLRRMWEAGVTWSAVGCDISGRCCDQARLLNEKLGCDKDITILEESYLDVDVPDESADLVISMDALLHVGPDRQRRAIQEAARILRPGGWMVFTDIMQQEEVDPKEMQPIYDRISLSKMGTVSNYKSALEEAGFTKFEFADLSPNVSAHYGSVLKVLQEKGTALGLSEEYRAKSEKGLTLWRDLAPKNIVWGFVSAQKTKKVDFGAL